MSRPSGTTVRSFRKDHLLAYAAASALLALGALAVPVAAAPETGGVQETEAPTQAPQAAAQAGAAGQTTAGDENPAAKGAAKEKEELENPLEQFGGKILGEPGERWHDSEDGRRYYLIEIDREPYFKIQENGRRAVRYVLLPPGAAYEVASETEKTVTVKIYDVEQMEANRKERQKAQEGREDMVADLEALEVPTVDRIQLAPSTMLSERGQWRQGFVLADINEDGHLDLVHGPLRKSRAVPRIFLGDGEGGWTPWAETSFESRPLDYGDIAVADFDGDGHQDIALAVHLRGVIVLRGDGAGKFAEWGEDLPYWYPGSGTAIQPFSSRVVKAVDWNRDGKMDLLTLGEGPRLIRESGAEAPNVSQGERGAILFLNQGDGHWTRYQQSSEDRQIFGDGLALGDFDGDGRTDFVVASNVTGATKIVKLGTEDGGWQDVSLAGLVRPGSYGAVKATDLDGDGRDELLLGFAAAGKGEDWFTGIDLVELEDGEWRRTALVAQPDDISGVTAIDTGDLDGDGLTDIVGLTGRGDRWVLLGTGVKTFVREASDELAPKETECQGYGVAIAPIGKGGASLLVMSFAGEPGSEAIIPMLERRCPSGGSLEVWSVENAGSSGASAE